MQPMFPAQEVILMRIISTCAAMPYCHADSILMPISPAPPPPLQGKLQEALEDYNMSIAICPWSVDPVLNRWAAW